MCVYKCMCTWSVFPTIFMRTVLLFFITQITYFQPKMSVLNKTNWSHCSFHASSVVSSWRQQSHVLGKRSLYDSVPAGYHQNGTSGGGHLYIKHSYHIYHILPHTPSEYMSGGVRVWVGERVGGWVESTALSNACMHVCIYIKLNAILTSFSSWTWLLTPAKHELENKVKTANLDLSLI